MDNQNQNTNVIFSAGDTNNPQTSSVSGQSLAEPQSLEPAQIVPPQPLQAGFATEPKQEKLVLRLVKRADVLLAILLVLGSVGLVLNSYASDKPTSSNAAGRYETTQIPLSDFVTSEGISFGTQSVIINGALQANDGLIISPTLQPTTAVAGQMYYDQTSNLLSYYNGTQFVPVGGGVQNIAGLTGQVAVGNGLSSAGGQLSNTGVLSLQGVTGDVTLKAGNGIAISGTTISNSGVVSVTSSSPAIVVTNDGAGNITLGGSGSGTVNSPGGTAGRVPLFTAAQTIENSIISQSGMTVTVAGDLAVVTGGLTLSNALSVSSGGTGATSLALNGVLVGQGTGAITSVASGASGLCFISTAGAPSWSACPGGAGVNSLNGLTGALNIANASGAGSTITIDNASTGAKGIAQFNSSNFNVSSGVVNTIQDIGAAATPTFAAVNTNNISPTAALTVGVSGQTALLQGSTTTITSSGAGNDIILNSADTIELQDNTNVTGNVTASGDIAVNGGDLTSSGALNITPGGALTVGASGQNLTLQGNASTSLRATNAGNTTIVGFVSPTANTTLNFPALSAGTYTFCTTSGNCAGAGVTLQAAYSNSTTPEIVLDATRGALTVRDAATPIGANLFEVQNNSGGTTYLAVTSSGFTVTGTASISGNIDSQGGSLQTGGTTRVDNTGNLTNIGSLTLSGAISGGTTFSGSGNINTTGGALQTNSTTRVDNSGNLVNIAAITASGNATLQGGTLTLGTTSQAGGVVIYDGSSNTGTLQTAALGQNTTYNLPDPGTATVTICVSTGNCAGSGTGVTSGGGTNNRLAKFTTGQNIENSTISDDGTTVTTTVDMTIQGGDVTVGTSSQLASFILHDGNGQTTTLRAGDSSGNLTFILPTTAGSANQCLKQSGTGNQLTWDNCDGGGGGSSTTLQQAYDNGNTITTDASGNISFTLNNQDFAVQTAAGGTGSTSFALADGSNATPAAQLVLIANNDTNQGLANGLTIISAAGGITDGLDVSDAELLNAINIGQNDILSDGISISTAELNLLNGHDVALVDTNDAVSTAITGTGALNSGSITSGFGSIDTGADNITTTGTVQGTTSVLTQSLDRTSAGALNIGASTATSIVLGQNTSLTGAATFTSGTGTVLLQGNTDIANTVSLAARRGATYTTAGSANDVALNVASLYVLDTSGAAQTITGIAAGRDGQILTLVNGDAALAVTLSNNSASSAAANRITTGTGADVSLAAGASATLVYDTASSLWRVVGGVAGGNGTCSGCANTALSNLSGTNINAALNATSANLNVTTTTSGNIVLNSAGTIELQDSTNITGTLGVSSTLTVTTGGLTVSAGGASIAGNTTIATTAGNTLGLGNSTGALTVTGSSSSTFVLNGVTVDATEFDRLDGKDAALVDTNDAVATAIIGTGALNAGSITSGFGSIDVGTDSIQGGTATLTGASALTLGTTGTNTGSVLFKGSTAASGIITLTLATNNPSNNTISLPNETGTVCTTGSVCSGYAPSTGSGAYATRALDNLASVAINTSLLTGAATIDLGSNASPFRDLYLGGTATNNFRFTGTAGAARTITLDDLSGRLALVQTAGSSSAQTGDLNLSGTLIGGTALQAPLLQTGDVTGASTAITLRSGNSTTSGNTGALTIATGTATSGNSGSISIDTGNASGTKGTITIGGTNASSLTLGRSGFDTTNAGNLVVQGTTGLTFNTGAGGDITFANSEKIDNDTNGQINLQADSGALTVVLTGTAANVQNSAGALTIDSASGAVVVATGDALQTSIAGNPSTPADGMIWYDSSASKYKVREGGNIKELCNKTDLGCGAGVTTPLQTAYNDDVDGSDAIIALTTADDSIIFRNPASNGTDSGYVFSVDQLNTGAIDGLRLNNVGTGVGQSITLANTSGTQTNGLLIDRNGASGTTTNGVNITNTAGTLTNGLSFTGTIGTDINRTSGVLTVQGGNGVSITGANTAGASGNITLQTGNSSGGTAGSVSIDTGTTSTGTPAVTVGATNAKSVTVGNTSAAAVVSIQGGTGSTALGLAVGSGGTINIGNSGVADTVQIGTTTGAVTQTINIGNNATASSVSNVTLGSTIGSSVTTIQGGSGTGLALSATGSSTYTTSGSLTIDAGGASTWRTTSGNLTVQANGTSTLSLQTSGAGTVSLGNQNSTTINIGAGSNIVRTFHIGDAGSSQAQTITLGSTGGSSSTLIQGGTGNVQIQTQGGTLGVGNNAVAQTLQIGNTTGATAVTIDSGTGNIALGTGAQARTINLGTGAAAQTVTVGSTSGASALTLQSGTGDLNITTQGTGSLNIGNNAVAQTLNIGNGTGATAVSVLCGTGTCGFGNNAVAHTTTLGSSTGAATTNLQAGTGGLALTSGANVTIGTSNTTGTLLVLDEKTDSGDPTGVLGGMYYNSNIDKFRCFEYDYGTSGYWRDCMASARTGIHYVNEMWSATTDGQIKFDNDSSSGGFNPDEVPTAGHPGIVTGGTGTGTDGRFWMGSASVGSEEVILGNGDYWRYETVMRIPTGSALSDNTNDYVLLLGFHDDLSSDGTDGCFFKYNDGVNSGKWQGICRAGGTASTCDTTVTVATDTWYRLTVAVNSAGTSADFQVTSGGTTNRCQVTTNIPTGASQYTGWANTMDKNLGTTDRWINVDYIELQAQFGTAR